MKSKVLTYSSLIGIHLLYACVTLFTKYVSQQEFMSLSYCLGLAGGIAVMGAYAIGWQQILKRVELSTAYMFKGTGIVFMMLIVWLFLGEDITINNIVGAAIIIAGITLYAKE